MHELEAVLAWVREHAELMWGVAVLSAITFAGTLVVVPLLLTWIPADYFLHRPREQDQGWTAAHPALRLLLRILKNVLGLSFMTAGLAMLVLPGQGLLTLLVGIVLLDLPGKRKLEIALLRRPHIHRAVNWLRRRRNRGPLLLPSRDEDSRTR